MIVSEQTTTYEQPFVPLSEKEHELHVHYASNALARGHSADCAKVTTARNWPQLTGRPDCTCEYRGR